MSVSLTCYQAQDSKSERESGRTWLGNKLVGPPCDHSCETSYGHHPFHFCIPFTHTATDRRNSRNKKSRPIYRTFEQNMRCSFLFLDFAYTQAHDYQLHCYPADASPVLLELAVVLACQFFRSGSAHQHSRIQTTRERDSLSLSRARWRV